jgi:hypothetical protein
VRTAATLVAVSLLAQGTGCSLLLMQRPPSGPLEPAPPIECTSSHDLARADSILGWTFLAVGGVAAGASMGYPPLLWGGVASALAGALLLGSSFYGRQAATDCVETKARQFECASGVEAACRAPTDPPDPDASH